MYDPDDTSSETSEEIPDTQPAPSFDSDSVIVTDDDGDCD